ncbi:MAG: hypothetical protein ABEI99_02355 [Halobaculum sp.]
MDREKAGIGAVALTAGVAAAFAVDTFLTPTGGAAALRIGEAFGFALDRVAALVTVLALLSVLAVYRTRS